MSPMMVVSMRRKGWFPEKRGQRTFSQNQANAVARAKKATVRPMKSSRHGAVPDLLRNRMRGRAGGRRLRQGVHWHAHSIAQNAAARN